MGRLSTLAFTLATCLSLSVSAGTLSLDQVLDSAKQHSPAILEANAQLRIEQSRVLEASGVYDTTLVQDNYARLSGFWDGKIANTQVKKRFVPFNGEVYAGYRSSTGDLPIYEDILFTNSRGELKVGVVLSLLQNRDFDPDRFKILQNRLKQDRAAVDLQLTQVRIQYQAMVRYAAWLAAGLRLEAYRDLLDLAVTRQSGFERRVKNGDLASIALTENLQNILKREVLLNEAERSFVNAAQELSFYYRSDDGQRLVPDISQIPTDFLPRDQQVIQGIEQDLERALIARPETRILANDIATAQADLKQGENLAKPKLDVVLETSRDSGTGSITRMGTDVVLSVNFSLPLERTTARGRINAARAKLDQLAFKRQRINDQLMIEIQAIANDIRAADRFVDLTGRQLEQAKVMQEAERTKFENGASDLFLLNLREENTADATIANIRAQADYFSAVAAYYAATVQMDKFGLN